MEQYPYTPNYVHTHGQEVRHGRDCGCGACQAIFQRHNEFQKCVCAGCQNRAIIPIHQKNWESKVSTLNICDRCETPATSNAMGSFTQRLSVQHDVQSVEMCPGCVAEFVAFMLGTTQDRPKAYKEPYTEATEEDDVTVMHKALRMLMSGKDDTASDDR